MSGVRRQMLQRSDPAERCSTPRRKRASSRSGIGRVELSMHRSSPGLETFLPLIVHRDERYLPGR
jgi:hypothetical protein